MLEFYPDTPDIATDVNRLFTEIEGRCGGKFFCFYQDQGKRESIERSIVLKTRKALQEMGHVPKLTILIDSPGGDADATFHLVRAFRQYADNVDAIVVSWAKSAATLLCLGADKIFMTKEAELGPLDAQLSDPRGSAVPKSALNAFKSLEYLQRYSLGTLELAAILMLRQHMDVPYAIEKALPFVSCIVTPLYQQVDPSELGEARRHLAVAEEYCKRIMKRYGYSSLSTSTIDKIVNQLVWEYPSHSFVIDLTEAQQLGFNVEELDDNRAKLCNELLLKTNGCFGFITQPTLPISTASTSQVTTPATPSAP